MIKAILNRGIRDILILLSCIVLGALAMYMVFLCPTEKINQNVEQSASVVIEEGKYPNAVPFAWSVLDNFTDSIMMLSASYEGKEDTIDKAMLVYEYGKEGLLPLDVMQAHFVNKESLNSTSYAQYWHGYLLVQKPLFYFFNLKAIRILNLLLQTIISVCLIRVMYKYGLKNYVVEYILTLCTLMPIAIGLSLQYSSVFYIYSIGSIVLIKKNEKWKGTWKAYYFFLILGCLTSFFDLLTYPVVTFGIPAILYVMLNKEDNVGKNIQMSFWLLFQWGLGYVGMWCGKWMLASILTKENVIQYAIFKLMERSSTMNNETSISIGMMLARNMGIYMLNPASIIMLIIVIWSFVNIIKKKMGKELVRNIKSYVIFLVVPFAWYLGTTNHSYIHCWFTYRDIAVFTFTGLCILKNVKTSYK